MIYRGFDITQNDAGLWEWTDEQGRIHNGKVGPKGGYKTDEEAMNAIDRYKRESREAVK